MEQENKKNYFPTMSGDLSKKIGWFVVILSLLAVVKIFTEIKTYRFVGSSATTPNQISVSGHGESYMAPDIASISFTIEQESKTVKEANSVVDEKTKKSVAFLKDKGVAEKDIKTLSNSFNPEYDYPVCTTYPCNQTPKLRGYKTSRNIEVKVRNLDTAATIVEGLGTLEVTNLQGPTFKLDDEDKIMTEARNIAITKARAKADELADELGVRIVRVISFSENTNGEGTPVPMMAMVKAGGMVEADTAAVQSPLPTGENKYTSDVTVTYEIR